MIIAIVNRSKWSLESLDELEALVRVMFARVPNKDAPKPSFAPHRPFTEKVRLSLVLFFAFAVTF